MPTTEIRHGDNAEILPTIPDKSVDFVFYDPPYNVKKKYVGFDDNLKPEQYMEWMRFVIEQSRRVARKGLAVYVGSKQGKLFWDLMPDAHPIPVHKRAIGAMAGNFFLQYHWLFAEARPVVKTKDLWADLRLPGEGYFFREPRYDTPGLTGLELTKRVLESFTVEGDTVLDPFLGTGTTAVACKVLNRNCIGIEQAQYYIEIAEKRLKEIE